MMRYKSFWLFYATFVVVVLFFLLALQVNSFKRASIVNLPNKVFMARISSLCHAVK